MIKLFYKTLLGLSLILSTTSYAQTYELNTNEMVKSKVHPFEFIGNDTSGNLYVSAGKTKVRMYLPLMIFNYVSVDMKKYIKKYDKDLNVISEQEITSQNPLIKQSQLTGNATLSASFFFMNIKEQNMNLPGFMMNGKYYMVIQDSKKPRNNYSLAEVDLETGVVNNATHILTLSKNKNEKDLKVKEFKVNFSPDSSHILFLATYQKDKTAKNGVAYSSAVFTKEMKPVFSSNYSLPKASNKYTIKNAKLTNSGEVLILGRYFDKKQKLSPGYISIYSLDQNNIKPKESRLKFGANYVNDAMLSLNAQNEPLVTGFYKDKAGKKGYDGIFYAALDNKRDLTEVKRKEFTAEFIGSDHTEAYAKKLLKKQKKGKDVKEDNDFGFSEFIPTNDGGYLGIAENYNVVKVTTTTTSTRSNITKTKTEYQHHYDDIMVFKYDKDANLQSMNKVGKQKTYVSSSAVKAYERDYTCFSNEGEVFVVFNDDPKAIDNKRKSGDRSNRDATYIVNIKPNGEFKKDVLISSRELGSYTFDPHKKLQVMENNRVAFIATKNLRNKKTMMGSFTIKKS